MNIFFTDPEDLPFEERMQEKGWPDEVSIANLSKACYPDDEEKRKRLLTKLIGSCRSGDIAYRGDIKGWRWGRTLYGDDSFIPVGKSKNPHDGTKGVPISSEDSWQDAVSSGDKWWAAPSECLIHKDEFKRYLQSVSQSSDVGFLANWWGESEQQTETVGNYDAGSQEATEAASIKSIQPSSNDFEWSGLLTIPSNAGNWGFVIDDMTRHFHQKNGRLPNKAEAWGQLYTNPPEGYSITVGKDKKLYMPSADPLTKRAFDERWKRYTSQT
ncbi:MAG: hypothetical protein ACXWT1_04760 [Methylobacter sp.]